MSEQTNSSALPIDGRESPFDHGPQTPPPWLVRLMEVQFELSCLGSVSIEVPALRPRFETLRQALDG